MPFFGRIEYGVVAFELRCYEGLQALLIGFDLLDVIAVFLDDDAGCFVLIVKRIGRDDFSCQRGQFIQCGLGGFEFALFAVSFFLEQTAIASGVPVSWSARVRMPMVSPINFPSMASAPGNDPLCS